MVVDMYLMFEKLQNGLWGWPLGFLADTINLN